MKEMNISKQNPKDRSKKKKFFEFLNLISELRDAELGILRFPPSEDSGEDSKVPCLLSRQIGLEEKLLGSPISSPGVVKGSKGIPKGTLSASLFLEVLQTEILSRLKAMDKGGSNK
jgi:hypothetical protein